MTRRPSKYEQAWRARAGHSDVAAPEPEVVVDVVQAALPEVVVEVDPAEPARDTVRVNAAETPTEDSSVHVGHTAEDCPYPAPRDLIITTTFTSSNIAGAELDTTTGILSVSFGNGSTYRYRNFTAELMAAWKAAKSAGSWFHHNVKTRAAAHPVIVETPAAPGEVADGRDHLG